MLLKLPTSFVDLIKVTRANRNVILGREVKGPVPRMSLNTIPKRLLPKNVGLLHLALLYVRLMSSAVAYAALADSFEAGGVAKQISPAAEGGKLDFDRY